MIGYVLRRLLLGLVTLFGVAVIVFFVMRVLPGDAAVMASGAGSGTVSAQELNGVRHHLGLDRPLPVQFVDWAGHAVVLQLGRSIRTGNPVMSDVRRRFPYTLQIVVMATVFAVVFGTAAGVTAAVHRGGWIDQVLRLLSIGGLAVPSFWLGLLVILGLVRYFQWSAPLVWSPFWDAPWRSLEQLFWPALVVGVRQVSLVTRMTRSSMLDVVGEDYVRTARSKGLSNLQVLRRHSLRNALLPVVTLVGVEFAALIGGLIVTETVFSVPGLGQYVVNSLLNRDYPAIQGVVMAIATVVVLANLAVDLIYGWVDPRIRLAQG